MVVYLNHILEEFINQQVFQIIIPMIKSMITFNPNECDHEFYFQFNPIKEEAQLYCEWENN